MTDIMLGSEARLQPPRTTGTFSSKIHAAKWERHYWRKILHLNKARTHYSLKKYYELHKTENINLRRHKIIQKIRESSRKIVELREKSEENRQEMLKNMIRHMSERDGDEAATEEKGIKSVLNAERSRKQFAELRRYKHPANRSSNGLEIPDVQGDVDEMWLLLKEERKDPKDIT